MSNYREGTEAFRRATRKKLEGFFGYAFTTLEREAKKKLRWRRSKGQGLGGRATGYLSHSITHNGPKISGGYMEGRWGTNVKYAKFVEGYPRPPRRHFVPFSIAPDLERWARRHGIEARGGLIVGGIDSTTPFLQPTIAAQKSRLTETLKARLTV